MRVFLPDSMVEERLDGGEPFAIACRGHRTLHLRRRGGLETPATCRPTELPAPIRLLARGMCAPRLRRRSAQRRKRRDRRRPLPWGIVNHSPSRAGNSMQHLEFAIAAPGLTEGNLHVASILRVATACILIHIVLPEELVLESSVGRFGRRYSPFSQARYSRRTPFPMLPGRRASRRLVADAFGSLAESRLFRALAQARTVSWAKPPAVNNLEVQCCKRAHGEPVESAFAGRSRRADVSRMPPPHP
jgi:hypothetical protein